MAAFRKPLIEDPREHFAALFGVSKNYVEMARTGATSSTTSAWARLARLTPTSRAASD